jgi:hypothetical protein
MDTFSLLPIDNTISDTNADVSFAIICDNPNNITPIKYIEVDLQSLASMVEWSGVLPAVVSPVSPSATCVVGPGGNLPAGVIRFTFIAQTNFKACNNRIEFRIANLQKIEGQTFPPSAPILFKLKTVTNAVIGNYPADYTSNTIQVAAKKPTINSCRINPSITRESTDITITYETVNASTCELKDRSGSTVHIFRNIDQTKPFRFTGQVHLGSEGTAPNPPFYLHAREGAMEARDNTVANVIVPRSPDWIVIDNFSRQVEEVEEGTTVEKLSYTLEQYKLLDLVLNESKDMMWAIMQKRTDLVQMADIAPCIWKSPDGISWAPHTYSAQDDTGVIRSVMLHIPAELAHCPCVHFGENELCFVGGSKIDIGVCSNTITVVNLMNGGIRQISAPAAMKPRCMHACVVYPDAHGNNNIWVIGGADKNGNGLNDVWRFDGVNWTAVPVDNPAFPKRCRFAATVQTDVRGDQSIWIGGGAVRYNGSTLNDLWVYKGSGWIRVRNGDGTSDLSYSEDWLAAASLCYVRTKKNSVVDPITNTYRYILSSDISGSAKNLTCSWISGVDIANNYYKWTPIAINKPELPPEFDNVRSFASATIGFNGCAWTVVLAYISKGNIAVSSLYYSCPLP